MSNTFIFLELSNNIFPLFINNLFQSCKIILQSFCTHMRIAARALVLVYHNDQHISPQKKIFYFDHFKISLCIRSYSNDPSSKLTKYFI
jgi:hypothetical protein